MRCYQCGATAPPHRIQCPVLLEEAEKESEVSKRPYWKDQNTTERNVMPKHFHAVPPGATEKATYPVQTFLYRDQAYCCLSDLVQVFRNLGNNTDLANDLELLITDTHKRDGI